MGKPKPPRQEEPGFVRPEGITKLNDSVWELYTPQDEPKVDVLLFHGLEKTDDYQEAYWKTWLSQEETPRLWPQTWLSQCIPGSRILSISYDSSARTHPGTTDSYGIAENLISDIIFSDRVLGQSDNPVILVGHCVGAIIIKILILACSRMKQRSDGRDLEKLKKFLRNCKGVFYYSPPFAGSRLADAIKKILVANGPIINLLTTVNNDRARINHDFAGVRKNLRIKTKAIVENLDTSYKDIPFDRFVEEASATDTDVDGVLYRVQADHFNVCRPKDQGDPILEKLVEFIGSVVEECNVNLPSQDRQTAEELK